MKKNYWKRVIAFLLVFVMVVQTMSLDAYAAMKTETAPDETVETETSEEAEEQQPAEIVGEMEEFRSEREKHFRLSDGSFIAVSYDYPVHYQEADGSWKEIDNTLFEEPDENGETVYKSGNTEVSVEFSGTLEEGELFTSSTDGHSVTMHLLDREEAGEEGGLSLWSLFGGRREEGRFDRNSKGKIREQEKKKKDPKEKGWQAEELVPEKAQSSVFYEDVFSGVDLLYTAYGNSVKEQILI